MDEPKLLWFEGTANATTVTKQQFLQGLVSARTIYDEDEEERDLLSCLFKVFQGNPLFVGYLEPLADRNVL